MGPKKLLIILTLGLVLLPATPALAQEITEDDIAAQLMCQCGCVLVLAHCDHIECGSGVPMKALVGQKLAQGESQQEILDYFVAQYGEQVLASPVKKGFNLIVWILPFAVILGGGGIVYVVLKQWAWRGRQPPSVSRAEEWDEDEKYQKQLEKELREFSGGGFR